MELQRYIEILKRRKWIVLLTMTGTIIAVALGSLLVTPMYSATAVVRIAQIQDSDIGYYDLNYMERLLNTYEHLLASRPFMEEVITRLGLASTPDDIAKRLNVETIPNTELLEITAESESPALAMQIANMLGDLLIEQREALYTGAGGSPKDFLSDQLAIVEQNLAEDRGRLQTLLDEGGISAGTIDDLSARIQVQEETYAILLREYDRARLAEAARANSVSIVEPASIPESPSKPEFVLNLFSAVLIGLSGGVALAILFESLDTTIHSPEDLEAVTELPLLGSIPRMKLPAKYRNSPVLIRSGNHSRSSEAFRVLRTNISSMLANTNTKTLLIASAEPQAGKSTVLANLAMAMAHAGRTVVMIDSDFRAPQLHQLFGRPNTWGLSNLITQPSQAGAVLEQSKTPFAGLYLITSGPSPLNPAERISSLKLTASIEELRRDVDMVLLDSPAILDVADAASLARMADGVVLVVSEGKTNEKRLHKAIDQMRRAGATPVGVVLNVTK